MAPTFNFMRLIKIVIRTGSGSNRCWNLADRLRQGNAGGMDLFKCGPQGDQHRRVNRASLLSCTLENLFLYTVAAASGTLHNLRCLIFWAG